MLGLGLDPNAVHPPDVTANNGPDQPGEEHDTGGEQFTESVGGVGAHAGQDVLVGGHREAGVGVAEALGDDLD